MNTIDRRQLQLLEENMKPAERNFNIVQILQLFPQSSNIHDIFKETCIHYECAQVCYKQINMFILGFLSRENSNNLNVGFKGERLRIPDKQDNDVVKVCFLNYKGTDNIKNVIVAEGRNKRQEKVFAVSNSYLKEFSIQKGEFVGNQIKIANQSILKAEYVNGLFGIVTIHNKFYLQAQVSTKRQGYKKKLQIIPNHIFSIPQYETVIFLSAYSQQNWLITTENTVYFIHIPLDQDADNFQITTKELKLNYKVLKGVKMSQGYFALLTEQKCILILNCLAMKITNRIHNDVQYSAICYNSVSQVLVASDFAGFMMAMSFHDKYGDLQEEGISFKQNKATKGQKQEKNEESQSISIVSSPLRRSRERDVQSPKKKSPVKKRNKIVDTAPLSKQMRTPYTIVIKNSSRKVLQLLYSKQKSIISYEGGQEIVIKFWDVSTLQVYKKLQIKQKISELKACRSALFSISSEKGHLNFFKFQKLALFHDQHNPMNIIDTNVESNNLFIHASNLKESIIYKLKLNHIPQLIQFIKFPKPHDVKTFKIAYFKNELHTFTLDTIHSHKLQVYGPFGLLQQTHQGGLDNFENIKKTRKNRVMLWGGHKMVIKGRRKRAQTLKKTLQKGGVVIERLPPEKEPNPEELVISTCSVAFQDQKIVNIGYLQGSIYVIVTQIPKKKEAFRLELLLQKERKVYILNQQLLTLSTIVYVKQRGLMFFDGYKENILFKKQNKFFLFNIQKETIIWKSQHIPSWQLQTVKIAKVNSNSIIMISIYKTQSNQLQTSRPVFLVKRYKVTKQRNADSKFEQYRQDRPIYENSDQHFKIADILHRSMPSFLTITDLSTFPYKSFIQDHSLSHIYVPQSIRNKKPFLKEYQLMSMNGKLLHYENKGILFVVTYSSLVAIYQISSGSGQVVGVIDLQNEQKIVEWNEQYKEEQHKVWIDTTKEVISYIDNKQALSPRLKSKKSINKSDYEFPKVIAPIKVYDDTQKVKIPKVIDPISVNQLFYKKYIKSEIQKSESKNLKKKNKQAKSQAKIHNTEKKYAQIIRKTTLISQTSSHTNFTKTIRLRSQPKQEYKYKEVKQYQEHIQQEKERGSSLNVNLDISTNFNLNTNLKKSENGKSERHITLKTFSKKKDSTRLQTQAFQQLQKSKLLQKSLLPDILKVIQGSVDKQKIKKKELSEELASKSKKLLHSKSRFIM